MKNVLMMFYLWGGFFASVSYATEQTLFDQSRNRSIPIKIDLPNDPANCSLEEPCSVALVSAGYGVVHTDYQFLTRPLTDIGFMVVAIGHELPSDPPLSVSGNLYETRQENWKRGAQTLVFVKETLQKQYKNYNFNELVLIGHSNGGDISAWLANALSSNTGDESFIRSLVTLDHRRVPLPRTDLIDVFSIRASDFAADKGVLLTDEERSTYNSCETTIAKAKHSDMTDGGPEWLKKQLAELVFNFVVGVSCDLLEETMI